MLLSSVSVSIPTVVHSKSFPKPYRMSSFSTLASLQKSEPSLCIPRVFPNITDRRVAYVLNTLHLGEIERIDMVQRETEDGVAYQRVFIHFKEWFNNRDANAVREKLVNNEQIKIVYDEPWFWKVSASRVNKPKPRRADKPKPRIELECPVRKQEKPKSFHESRMAYQKKFEEERARHIAENGEPCPGCESGVDSSAAHCDEDGSYPHPNCCSAPGQREDGAWCDP